MTIVQVIPNESIVKFLQEQLPREGYPSVKSKHKELILHYLIALDQPSETILKWLDVCNKKHHDFINAKDSSRHINRLVNGTTEIIPATGLTPLACAVLMQREDIVEAFCLSPHLDPEVQDNHGWTVLQHAIVIGNPRILEHVESVTDRAQLARTEKEEEEAKGSRDAAVERVEISANQRFPFLRSLLQRPTLEDGDPAVRYQVKPGQVIDWTQKECEEKIGVRFYDRVWGTGTALFYNWKRTLDLEASFRGWLEEAWQAYLRKPPPLLLYAFKGAGLGVISQRKLPKGKIVCTYGSELISPTTLEQDLKRSHSNNFASGASIRSFGSMINDGLPNVIEMPVKIEGVEVCAILTIGDFEAQDQLFLDYGPFHLVKWGPRSEMKIERVYKMFPTKNSIKEYWKPLSQEKDINTQSGEYIFLYHCRRSPLGYLFSTPSLLIGMMIEGRVSLHGIEELLKNPTFIKFIEFNGVKGPNVIEFYMKALNLISRFESTLPSHIKHELRRDLAVQIQSNVRAGIFAFELMLDHYSEGLTAMILNQRFQKIYEGTEALFSLLEERGSPEESLGVFQALEKTDQQAIISLSKGSSILIFGERDSIPKVYAQLEA